MTTAADRSTADGCVTGMAVILTVRRASSLHADAQLT
jgi:hypothetical protein